MAVGMRVWLGIVTVALLLVAGWGLSPVLQYPEARQLLPERVEFLEVDRELSLEGWTYQRMFRRDTLVGELQAGVADGRMVVVGLPSETPDSTVEKLDLALARQMADLEIDQPALPIGLFVIADGDGAYPGMEDPFSFLSRSDEVYLARGGESPYCILAAPFRGRSYGEHEKYSKANTIASDLRYKISLPRDPRQPINLFGVCRFFARHGSPGDPMLDWLQAGASAFARNVVPADHHLRLNGGPARGPFGKVGRSWYGGSARTDLCLSGSEESCSALILDPVVRPAGVQHREIYLGELLKDSPVDLIPRYSVVQGEMLGNQGHLLSLLEREFGAERFGIFWRSDLPVAEAFQMAFGQSLDRWTMDWLRRYVDPPARGPGVPAQATLLTLMGIGLLAGGAVRMGRR